jgi:hypothetical protein
MGPGVRPRDRLSLHIADMISKDSPFSDLPHTARAHLGLRFYEAALTVLRHLHARALAAGKDLDTVLAEFPFLSSYCLEIERRLAVPQTAREQATQLRTAIAQWENAEPTAWLPIRELGRSGLEPAPLAALLIASLVEEEAGFGQVFAALQPGTASSRPSLGLLRTLTHDMGNIPALDPSQLLEPLLERGLVEVINRDAPRAEWVPRVPAPLWMALRGTVCPEPVPGVRHLPIDQLEGIDRVILPASIATRLESLTTLLSRGRINCLAVRGTPGTDRLAVVAAVAHTMRRGVLRISVGPGLEERLRLVAPLATVLRAMPVFETELGPGDIFTLPKLETYRGPLGVLLGVDGGLAAGERAITVTLPPDPVEVRQRCWERELGDRGGNDITALGHRFTASGGLIREYASLSLAYADLAGRRTVSVSDVRQAARSINRQQLDTLAARLEGDGGWTQLVVPEQTLLQLLELERRCREREPLCTALGHEFPGGFNRGVRALFEGASGTGKTLAARALAAELGLDIYRVDLAAVVNKYVGETEKNLSRLLGRAEDLDVVLLLDEGDALLARRTDVRTANDRYANLETNYLLQRLETYQGIVVVTTNLGGQIDPAFRRRMDVSIKFPSPQPSERWQLWTSHLPSGHDVPVDALEEIASRYAFTGSQIRNAVVHGSLVALGRSGVLQQEDLLAGIEVEHRKAGASLPVGSMQRGQDPEPELRVFLDLIK